jgi:hypothetical protein
VLANNQLAGLPAHDVAANQGQFLALLVRMVRAQRVLEIGTLGAYSSIWMARELPEDGELLTLKPMRIMPRWRGKICAWRGRRSGHTAGRPRAAITGSSAIAPLSTSFSSTPISRITRTTCVGLYTIHIQVPDCWR